MKEIILTYGDRLDMFGNYLVHHCQELVRCRDCKHYRQDGFCTYNNHVQSDPDWFCADGERSDDS